REKTPRDKIYEALTLAESLAIARTEREAAQDLDCLQCARKLIDIARDLARVEHVDARNEAQVLYFHAHSSAIAARDDRLSAEIWGRLVQLALQMDAGTDQALAWWKCYEAAVRRATASGAPWIVDAYEVAKLHHLRGEIHYRDSQYAEAENEQKLAIK